MDNTEWDIETCMDKIIIPSEKREIYEVAVEAELRPA